MQTHLVKRGNVYCVRRKVPTDLLQHYPHRDMRESLRTSDKATAIERARARVAELDAEFAQRRASSQRASAGHAKPLTADLVSPIARALVAHILTADDEQRMDGMDEAAFEARSERLQADLAELRKGLQQG